jgi:hypothetical protein
VFQPIVEGLMLLVGYFEICHVQLVVDWLVYDIAT